MGCALPSVHHCCFVSPRAGPCSETLTAELILWPVTQGMAPLPPAEHICSSLRSLDCELLPISNHHLEVTQWQHLYFICFSAVPQEVGDSSMDSTRPFRKGTVIYWLWCKFTRLIYRGERERERPAAAIAFFLSFSNFWCIFLCANLPLAFCSCKKDKV